MSANAQRVLLDSVHIFVVLYPDVSAENVLMSALDYDAYKINSDDDHLLILK